LVALKSPKPQQPHPFCALATIGKLSRVRPDDFVMFKQVYFLGQFLSFSKQEIEKIWIFFFNVDFQLIFLISGEFFFSKFSVTKNL
jgi:hypothetical protein